jgi:hypothetical protein
MFVSSPEYRTLVVGSLYGYVLGRAVDSVGLNAKLSFLNQGGTVEQMEADLLGSDEYFFYPTRGNGKNDVFLQALYRDVLQRAIDPSGMAVWGRALANGTSRKAVAAAILAGQESDQLEVQALWQFIGGNISPVKVSEQHAVLLRLIRLIPEQLLAFVASLVSP